MGPLLVRPPYLVTLFCLLLEGTFCADNNLHKLMTGPELNYYFGAHNSSSVPDYEVVFLPVILPVNPSDQQLVDPEPVVNSDESKFNEYNFTAFGRDINLKLVPNRNLVAPNFKVYKQDASGTTLLDDPVEDCHYLHRDMMSVAALSACSHHAIHGLVFLGNSTLEIQPLTPRLQSLLKLQEALRETNDGGTDDTRIPHIVKRAPLIPYSFHSDAFPVLKNVWNENRNGLDNSSAAVKLSEFDENEIYKNNNELIKENTNEIKRASTGRKTIELALFFDAAGYKLFSPFMNSNDKQMRNLLLAYVNGVQALYHHPSLGTIIDLVLVRMDMMKTQPKDLPHYNGERSMLLDSFCDYQKRNNPPGDSNPDHWDMALYVSGLDFYAIENGRKSGVTMGLATVGGVCLDKYNCLIAELGTTNVFGKPYPSAGFTSVYILAHEIGHNLGMHHDSSGNNCPKEGYIMSPSRGTNGETLWSSCSAEVMQKLDWAKCLMDKPKSPPKELDHTKFLNTPGQMYGAKRQCEVLLRDKDAMILPNQALSTICYNLQCKTPHRSGYYFAGPALEGTECGNGKWCHGGECVKKTILKPIKEIPGGWGPWAPEECKSGCIEKSLGYQGRHRKCDSPVPQNTEKGCDGPSFDVVLCKDSKICTKNARKPVTTFASAKCKEFAKLLPELDPKGSGLQAPHETARPWMGCAIFCKRADSGSYYTPRLELNDLGVSAYFPDGTWCNKDSGGNYYCQQHHCLPENFQFTKTSLFHGIGEDVQFPQNAHPRDIQVPPYLLSYLSLGADGKPLQTTLRPGHPHFLKEEDWETRDYIELPHDTLNGILSKKRDNNDLDGIEAIILDY